MHTTEMAARRPKGFKGKQPYKNNPKQRFSSKLKDWTFPNSSRSNSNNLQGKVSSGSNQEMRLCHKCGRKGLLANNYQTPKYFVNLYKELQKLKAKEHKTHTLDAPTLDAIENYMLSNIQSDLGMSSGITIMGTTLKKSLHTAGIFPEVALLNNATIHTIMRDPLFFSYTGSQTKV